MTAAIQRTRNKLTLQRRHRRMLYLVAKLHYVSVEDLRRALCYAPGSYEWVRKSVLQLWRQRYLERQILQRKARSGSSPYVYRLDTNGYAELRTHHEQPGLSLPLGYRDRPASSAQLPHDFAVNAFLIAGLQLAQREPELFITRFEHDRSLRGRIRVELPDGKAATLNPDGYLEFIYRERWLIPLLFECGRNHHEVERWREKIRRLVAYMRGDQHRRHFGSADLTIPCFVDGGQAGRVEQLRGWTALELEASGAMNLAGHFLFAHVRPAQDRPETLFKEPLWRQALDAEPVALVAVPKTS